MKTPHRAAIVLFCRTPRSEGASKDFGLGGVDNLRLSRGLLCQTLDTVGRLPDQTTVVLLTDGHLDDDDRGRLGRRPVVQLHQRGASFQDRLLDGLRRVAGLGFERLVVVGSDTPGLRAADLRQALCGSVDEVVVGASRDGGCYLIGLDGSHLGDLDGLPWCTSGLLGSLCRRICSAGLRVRLLTCRADVDSAGDVNRRRHCLDRLCRRVLGCGLGPESRSPSAERSSPAPVSPCGDSAAIRAPPVALPGR
jgi:glycosyltransferase A (GT-A) superfamily protein (DUF2064 family)